MPQTIKQVIVFLASPEDVEEERHCLERVIQELNLQWETNSIQLRLVSWETHAFPGFDNDAQSVINKQLPVNYDIFVGIMWCRAGTPTERATSGTIEEFERAKKRYDDDPESVQLMFYFKQAAAPLSSIDPVQLQAVRDFQKTLGEEGGLYWSFNTTEDFERNVRLHLAKCLQKFTTSNNQELVEVPDVEIVEIEIDSDDADEDMGLLDWQDVLTDQMTQARMVADRISDATNELGGKMKEINSGNKDRDLRLMLRQAAVAMENYELRIKAEQPLLNSHLEASVQAITEIIPIQTSFFAKGIENEAMQEQFSAIRDLSEQMGSAITSLEEMQSTISSLPRMQKRFNQAKRRTVEVLELLLQDLRKAKLALETVI